MSNKRATMHLVLEDGVVAVNFSLRHDAESYLVGDHGKDLRNIVWQGIISSIDDFVAKELDD